MLAQRWFFLTGLREILGPRLLGCCLEVAHCCSSNAAGWKFLFRQIDPNFGGKGLPRGVRYVEIQLQKEVGLDRRGLRLANSASVGIVSPIFRVWNKKMCDTTFCYHWLPFISPGSPFEIRLNHDESPEMLNSPCHQPRHFSGGFTWLRVFLGKPPGQLA